MRVKRTMKVSHNKEEKNLAYQVFHTDYFTLRLSTTKAEKFNNTLRKVIDKRGDWESMLYQELMKKMSFVKAKDAKIKLDNVEYEGTVQAFAEAYIKVFKVDTTPQQQTITEALAGEKPGRMKIKPIKKSLAAAEAKEKAPAKA